MKDRAILIQQYLKRCHVMQLATVANGRPWVCTVYYVVDEELNLYWASLPVRRHSQDINNHPAVAAAIAVQAKIGRPVIGIQIEGTASVVTDKFQIAPIAEQYAKRFGRGEQWTKDFAALKTEHRLYKLVPAKFVLFDEQNFPHNTRIEWKPEE